MAAFYFAWAGGDPIPALSLNTSGDIWSGSAQTRGTLWGGSLSTTGDIITPTTSGSATLYLTVSNLRDTTGLVAGNSYAITGAGVPGFTSLSYDGFGGGALSQPCSFGEGVSLTLSNPAGTDQVTLDDISALVSGTVYGIIGSGVSAGTEFTFEGSPAITISAPATATGLVLLTMTNPNGRNTISNIADVTGLITGYTYEVFAPGLPAGAEGTYTGGNSLTLFGDATKSGVGVPLAISKGKTYPDGGPFDPAVHAREDVEVFEIEITHEEGNFPSLKIEIRNPRIGLLAAGRNLWCWLSWDSGAGVVPLFHGRLMGIPANLDAEVVTLQFVARPNDYAAQKKSLAETLKVRPFWDPVWLSQGHDDPDTVLEARPASWHIGRVDLAVSVSDHNIGEDGTLVLTADDHFYDGLDVSYGTTPLRRVTVTGLVSWTQSGTGVVDITQQMVDAFRNAGSPYFFPIISSFTGPGLLDSWPKPGTSIGAGWAVDATASIEDAITWIPGWLLPKAYLKPDYQTDTIVERPGNWGAGPGPGGIVWHNATTTSTQVVASWETWATLFVLSPYAINFTVRWTAARPRTETISFVLDANVQALLTDPGGTEVEAINLSSNLVGEAIDRPSAGAAVATIVALASGQTVTPGTFAVFSPNGRYKLQFQFDGNLVLLQEPGDVVVWASGTIGATGMTMQSIGNLVIYTQVNPPYLPITTLFNSTTNAVVVGTPIPGSRLILQDDGNLVVYPLAGSMTWASGTGIAVTAEFSSSLLPIGDLRRNAYFTTDRGAQSIEYLIALARAKLLARARAVNLRVATTWATGIALTCRQNVEVLDDRLPAGSASGKVTKYVLRASGQSGEQSAEITLGCSVGYGGVVIPAPGAASYVDNYVDGYQRYVGATIDPGTADVAYQSLDGLSVVDDDGVDLFNMTPARVINSIGIEGGVNHQAFTTLAIFPTFTGQIQENITRLGSSFGNRLDSTWANYVEPDDPTAVLGRDPTIVTLDLVPIGTQAFETNYAPSVSMLAVPQTINTEAP